MSAISTPARISTLVERLRSIAGLAGASSAPLYQRLITTTADLLCEQPEDKISEWLGQFTTTRSDLEVSLLFLAAMHREVLLGSPGTELLREYYPSAGGVKSASDKDLPEIFLEAVRKRMDYISDFIKTANVQTNETGRGVFWLLPASCTGWKDIHLVELGASAGLNLVADERRYSFVDNEKVELSIGKAKSPQFLIQSTSNIPTVLNEALLAIPNILSRRGCDMFPFCLDTDLDRTTMTSYVFADQVHRIERLKEGIAAYEGVQSVTPIAISTANLPDDLPSFLGAVTTATESAPVLIYNTCITGYLRGQGRELRLHIEAWAESRQMPVLWVQLESLRDDNEKQEVNTCAWTVDYWDENHDHKQWHLGWVHPHGFSVIWKEEELKSFIEYFR